MMPLEYSVVPLQPTDDRSSREKTLASKATRLSRPEKTQPREPLRSPLMG
jgi:hypothetical protein